MRRRGLKPTRVLITLDAVGGVWRYAVDLAQALDRAGVQCLLAGFGPRPGDARLRQEAAALAAGNLTWTDQPLDWMVEEEDALAGGAPALARLARQWQADLLHLNLPSQAVGIPEGLPVVVTSHSCLPTWWEAVRGVGLPADWQWQRARNRGGFDRADRVLVPSRSHGAALARAYGPIGHLQVVPNATASAPGMAAKEDFVLAAGRWWDAGKNAATLDAAAAGAAWPLVAAGPLAGPNGERTGFSHALAIGDLPGAELRILMARAAIFVAPSRYEPFGLAVLEAAASGAALVLADIPTFRELWEGCALFVPPTEPEAYRRAIGSLAGDLRLRARMGDRARRRAGRFTPQRQVEAVLEAYRDAFAARAAPAEPLAAATGL